MTNLANSKDRTMRGQGQVNAPRNQTLLRIPSNTKQVGGYHDAGFQVRRDGVASLKST